MDTNISNSQVVNNQGTVPQGANLQGTVPVPQDFSGPNINAPNINGSNLSGLNLGTNSNTSGTTTSGQRNVFASGLNQTSFNAYRSGSSTSSRPRYCYICMRLFNHQNQDHLSYNCPFKHLGAKNRHGPKRGGRRGGGGSNRKIVIYY